MSAADLLLALLLPVPPWIGFMVYRVRGRVGLSYGYFLGGILGVLSLPWPRGLGTPVPVAELGGALFGFSLYLLAHREGRDGLRRLALGVGGTTLFAWLLAARMGLSAMSLLVFWVTALAIGGLWLLLSDLGFRWTHGRWLQFRVPLVGALTMFVAALLSHLLPRATPPLPWLASTLAGLLLGLVALHQLLYLRRHGIWIEGRGEGFRVALSALEIHQAPEPRSLGLVIEAHQPILLVNERGMLLEGNSAFAERIGLQRHLLRGYELQAFFQGQDVAVWDDLKEQLLKAGHGRALATLVRQDGAFSLVELEASGFDRNLALVWVSDVTPGSITLREDGHGPALVEEGAHHVPSRQELINALGTIVPAAEQILLETQPSPVREAAELILVAAQRLSPDHRGTLPSGGVAFPKALADQWSRLTRMLPREIRLDLHAEAFTVQVSMDALRRILVHLTLHGRQGLSKGTVHLHAEVQDLGGQPWCRLSIQREGSMVDRGESLVGLGWLIQACREAQGMLDLRRDDAGFVWPQIWLPMALPETQSAPSPLLPPCGIWIVERDRPLREALSTLCRKAGAEVRMFEDLRDLLRHSRGLQAPDLLVMERTPRLERFRHVLGPLHLVPVPMLLVGTRALLTASDPIAFNHRRVAFLEKPFSRTEFLQSLRVLLNEAPVRL